MSEQRRIILLSLANLALAIGVAMLVGSGCGFADLMFSSQPFDARQLGAERLAGFPVYQTFTAVNEQEEQGPGPRNAIDVFDWLFKAHFLFGFGDSLERSGAVDSMQIALFVGTNLFGSPERAPSREQIRNMPRLVQFRIEGRDADDKRIFNLRLPRQRLDRQTGNYAPAILDVDEAFDIPEGGRICIFRMIKGSPVQPGDIFEYAIQIARVPAEGA